MDIIKIITKTGDRGATRNVDGDEISKLHPSIVAVGKIDTLCA